MNIFDQRKKQIVGYMKEKNVKAVILNPSANMLYMTSFTTFPGERMLVNIITDSGNSIFIVPKLYEQEVKERACYDELYAWDDSENPVDIIKSLAVKHDLKDCNIAVDDTMWFSIFLKLLNNLNNVKYICASDMVGCMRECKSAEEIEKMRNSSRTADKAIEGLLQIIKSGMKECEVKKLLEDEMKALGFTSPSFDTIVGSGPFSALPHYTSGERVLKEGDSVVIDFGGILEGYCSDMTRTIFIGEATEEYKKVYNIVKEANRRAIAAVRPGIMAKEVDFAARSYIEESGYGEFFIHRTGHGIGLEVHETPYISDSNEVILKPGMMFSIEPGIYMPEKFGVRIEDLVVVTEDGVEVLNQYTKDLTEIR